ncbi:hypothetical protein CKAN_00969500 [Cinnamomum micranthum f. kanehirae]|uniref:Uncharacterized protein n=1 Tax=Cinnamomum micranthum f. kanehirae TaxID=337451 RepID=A0A3S3Q7Z6_9MAGN|nr:hypothetical protein CKAN_00969500 [Cinnamomum micranthum f. kanehirae]
MDGNKKHYCITINTFSSHTPLSLSLSLSQAVPSKAERITFPPSAHSTQLQSNSNPPHPKEILTATLTAVSNIDLDPSSIPLLFFLSCAANPHQSNNSQHLSNLPRGLISLTTVSPNPHQLEFKPNTTHQLYKFSISLHPHTIFIPAFFSSFPPLCLFPAFSPPFLYSVSFLRKCFRFRFLPWNSQVEKRNLDFCSAFPS